MGEKKQHGGARPVVREDDGRLTDDPRKPISVSLPQSLVERLDALEGGRTANVERALRYWLEGEK